ncbi:GNAT family N-acetyltransferase [Peribacillus psychrosaccharolyticus]|uniref:GNAT family N-acetyltransferase n=1 Tax=Peribacillus psychrosaccharolyticus TaxID=1407 RepID=A0A974NRL4_PERPY|nr:GNAT family N-acetyltransferase [Peribacillus psychrosaccharolyticus]MEC2056453.1 GNAT family N-acetyltransferase [Peribacillus psychrosaccharolyticus]MED3745411.1 GNAT family N-acetyltransferase [Peribacillus psychrosaccharolyticus]QQT02811.1 GNAT family N-acetyltransferase [Peribacillus psychrosaccharolyticus]
MGPIVIEMPSSLETDRLLLRVPFLSGDGRVVNKAIRESIAELSKWLPFAQEIPPVEETESNLRNAHIKFLARESFRFLIFHKETDEYIGTSSIHNIDWEVKSGDIGYWIDKKYSGNGYMTEAIKRLTDLGMNQLGFNRLEIRCEAANVKSQAIPEKLGFKLEAVLKNEDLSADGKTLTDTYVYGMIMKDYEEASVQSFDV